MNRTGIEWTDYTWNPMVGCTHGCPFCYARRMARRQMHNCALCGSFTPHLHPERLDQPARVTSPRIVFAGSMGDMFDPEVCYEGMRELVWCAMDRADWHHYVVLTKRPDLIDSWEIEDHARNLRLWLGVSVTCDDDWWRVIDLLDAWDDSERAFHPIVSFEPLLGAISEPISREIEWVIVGAQTGPGAVQPPRAWTTDLWCQWYMRGPLFEKDNLREAIGRELYHEWPEAMVRETTGRARRPSPAGRCAAHSAPPPVGRCAPEGGRGAKVTARDDNGVGLEARPTRRDDADRGE